ncbi:unnamed protein product [Onchocerca flexuosa]|uniref:AMP-binding domain-containing protein n=1 Tax=Onchocerca flexuosa TaxID=387005 RepID=A0A183HJ53_9BILA|nr:unnamed protein product [Onchocerca flexuosa]
MKPDYGMECVNPDDIACICYTAGTTGLPKGAMLSHGGLTWNAEALIDMWKFSQKDVLLHMLPFDHIHGMFISLNCSLFTKSSIIFRPKFDVNDALNWLPRCTVMMGVPTYYSRLLQKNSFDKSLAKNIRLFISGSAPLSTALWEDFNLRTGHEILERYGMTEGFIPSFTSSYIISLIPLFLSPPWVQFMPKCFAYLAEMTEIILVIIEL